jgi:hypothetical protein
LKDCQKRKSLKSYDFKDFDILFEIISREEGIMCTHFLAMIEESVPQYDDTIHLLTNQIV